MKKELDVLASAIHDAKNQLFFAETAAAEISARENIDLGQIRSAIEQANSRLINALTFYRVMDEGLGVAISIVPVTDVMEDGLALCGEQLRQLGIDVQINSKTDAIWPIDRDLIIDMMNNAMQNAGRHARHSIRISAREEDGWLVMTVEDDGPGVPVGDAWKARAGIGLFVAERVAALHRRHEREGRICLYNGGELGGAVFELWLP